MLEQGGDACADPEDEHAEEGAAAKANAGAACDAVAETAADAALPASERRQTDARGAAAPPASRRRRGEPAHCQVPSCGTVLQPDVAGRRYSFRYRVCEPCMRADHCILDTAGEAMPQRFCQKCSRFQPLSDFDGSKRTCARQLALQNARRAARSCGATTDDDIGGGAASMDDEEGGMPRARTAHARRSSVKAAVAAAKGGDAAVAPAGAVQLLAAFSPQLLSALGQSAMPQQGGAMQLQALLGAMAAAHASSPAVAPQHDVAEVFAAALMQQAMAQAAAARAAADQAAAAQQAADGGAAAVIQALMAHQAAAMSGAAAPPPPGLAAVAAALASGGAAGGGGGGGGGAHNPALWAPSPADAMRALLQAIAARQQQQP